MPNSRRSKGSTGYRKAAARRESDRSESTRKPARMGVRVSGADPCACGHAPEEHGRDSVHPGSTGCTECDCIAYEADPMADVKRAKAAFDTQRDRRLAAGMEVCFVVVGYADGREPFRLLGRVSADLGLDTMPDPPLTMAEMQPVAFAAKMAIAKVLVARARKGT